ncbi:MAG: DNA polymerase III subunit delta [Acidobacteriia bacterium]|nr:DNA polymerase III subunit delta [Terriglobia bacterium]
MATVHKFTPTECLAQFNQKKFPSSLLLLGEETFFHEQLISALKTLLWNDPRADFSTFTFLMSESHLEDAIEAASTNSLLAPQKLVIIRGLEQVRENQIRERDEEAVARYLERPNPQTILVVQAEKLDGRRRLTQQLQKHSWVIDCCSLPNEAVVQWIGQQVSAEGVSIDAYAARELVEAAGNSLTLLQQEIKKLVSFVGDRRRIQADDVDVLMFRARVNTVFELVDAINQRNRAAAIRIVRNLFENDSEVGILMYWLDRLYRQLVTLKDQPRKLDGWGAVRLLRVPRDYAERLVQQEKHFTREELLAGFHKFAAFDRGLRTYSFNSQVQFEFLILELIGNRPAKNA